MVFFRKPRDYSEDVGARIVAQAVSQVGKDYDTKLLLAQGAAGTFLGRLLGKVFGGTVLAMIDTIISMPPMVGVPALDKCDSGPSSRTF